MASSITLRPIVPEDEPFLRAVYDSTRQAELARVPWTDEEKASFLAMQFAAQSRFYFQQYAAADFQLILRGGAPIGRLYVDRQPNELRIIDIALVDAARDQGIGTGLLGTIIEEADQATLPITIHVERFNPALRLYSRLGFQAIADQGVYLLLRRLPRTSLGPSTSAAPSSASTLPVAQSLLAGDPQ